MNYYQILNLKENASASEIKQAYRKLAMKYHPDRNKGDTTAETKFKEINEAYSTLSDPKKKEEYDYGLKQPKQVFNKTYNQPQQTRTYRSNSYHTEEDIYDIFKNFFSHLEDEDTDLFRRKNKNRYYYEKTYRQESNKNVYNEEITLSISLWESIKGVTKTYKYKYGGKEYQVALNIPAGVGNNTEFALNISKHNKSVLVKVKISPNKYFIRKDLDLITNLVVGENKRSVILKHWKGNFEIKIPEGIKNETTLSLRGLGIEKDGKKGNLLLKVHLLPKNINTMPPNFKKILRNQGFSITILNNQIRKNLL